MATGIDFAFDPHPSIAVDKAHGVTFACRYISPTAANDVNGKNLIPSEKAALLAAGLSIVMVFESSAGRMKSGQAAGVADAQDADAVVKALGMPGMPVYFACDWDATEADQVLISAYLDGAASVIGVSRTGIYGGFYPVQRALDAGKAHFAWQTYAWSGSQWDSRAQLRQDQNGVTMGGASVDMDQSMAVDFGQWPRPVTTGTYPVPSGIGLTVHPSVNFTWPAGDPVSPHWRLQVMRDVNGQPGDVIGPNGSVLTTIPRATVQLPGPGTYWVKVQAAGNSPFSVPRQFTA